MFKKKDGPSAYTQQVLSDLNYAVERLEKATEDTLVKTSAVNLYPAGPEHSIAERDAKMAQQILVVAAKRLDGQVRVAKTYFNYAFDMEESTFAPRIYPSSHRVIENAVRNFYKSH